ncbi:MAG TPA: sulfopyruvate decarboxylase subunit alpha [Nitrospiraceae bacterium]|jgi:sulfopyruvate decarboxylase subunit beta|nr:sulfopyruvate decarboxylase subunit alpha [Nitrospiraceae bacterium]
MPHPENELIAILEKQRIDFTASLPCEKIKVLLEKVKEVFFHVPLTREEEGVGICAGAALSGKRPAIFVQSSGIGNMINALLSLTGSYRLPLAIFVSQRGIYKEKIAAQFPMGKRLPMILKGAGIAHSIVGTSADFKNLEKKLAQVYGDNTIHAFLLSPAIWEETCGIVNTTGQKDNAPACPASTRMTAPPYLPLAGGAVRAGELDDKRTYQKPKFTRFEILTLTAPYLESKVVVCNLGFPSKELFRIKHQSSNFYMLGSMGMATPIGLGIALMSDKKVVVIDGDGSLLMNPGSLATAAHFSPGNLMILGIDNGSYGSTGNQPTLTKSCVDLELVAKGFGIKSTYKVSGRKPLLDALTGHHENLRFIHILAVPGNKDLPDIPLNYIEIKKQVQDFISRPQ